MKVKNKHFFTIMNDFIDLLPRKIFEALDRAGICSLKQIITMSCWDIKKVTNLCKEDLLFVKDLASEHVCPKSVTCSKLRPDTYSRVTSGCRDIDMILGGGFRKGTITEIYGESGSGKTQIGLQAVAHNWPHSSVYICTEDLFPIKRYHSIMRGRLDYNPNVDYGSTTFVEHITESKDLLSCVKVRLPKLLAQYKLTLIVIDSVAAPFRVASTNYIQRAQEMKELAISLLNLAQEYGLAVLCINQVTAAFNSLVDMLPSLGLAWSNMVSTRLHLKKNLETFSLKREKIGAECSHVRELSVIFAPDVENVTVKFVILSDGLWGM